jgi:tetratricopeptide (TPR) repeat protein
MRRSDTEELDALMDEDPQQAIVMAQRIVDESPTDPDTWAWLAETQMSAGDTEGALRSLAEYVKRDPEWIEAYTLRAALLADIGRFSAASIELEVAQSIDAEDPRIARTEATILELQGQFPAADLAWKRAVDLGSEPPTRLDRTFLQKMCRDVLRDAAREGLKLSATYQEVPTTGGVGKPYARPLERVDARTIIVYLRNLERELPPDAEAEDVQQLFADLLADLLELPQ